MAQYGQPMPGYGQPGQPPVPSSAPAPSSGGSSGHSKRRMYPQQQYDFNAPAAPSPYLGAGAPAPEAAGVEGYPGYGGATAGGVFTPAAAVPGVAGAPAPGYEVDNMANQFGQMGLNQQPNAPMSGGGYYQQGPQYGQQQQPQLQQQQQPQLQQQYQKLPLNQLYNIDLIQSLPPPISDLALPSPPLIIPQDASIKGNPEANATPEYIRSTLNVIPTTNSLLKKSKLPLALVVRPYTSLIDFNAPVPVVEDTVICRCRRCRCYMNPFVQFLEQQHRWKCNMCGLTNEVPAQFDWNPVKNERVDRFSRNEISYGVCEFVAPQEYMVRTPQPPVYVFIIDVSINSVATGLLATVARTIQESLDRLPNKDNRTKVGFIAVDSSLHFFSIPLPSSQQTEPSMMVVSDLDDPFLPLPTSLLVNLTECRESIDNLLSSLGEMFQGNNNSSNALGSALKAGNKLIGNIGGKIICLTASLPNVGVAKLEIREDRKLLGTSKENSLLQPGNSFYKSFAVECNRTQVTIDMFLFSSHYQDVASLSYLPRYTGGQTYYYPGWNAKSAENSVKFAHEFGEHLSQEIATEAVLRVRASTGLHMNAFYGNFFNRSSDLCSFSTFPRDQSYVIEVTIEETITKPYVCFQAAILHTTCEGERRIRTITVAIPTSASLQDIYASADQLAIAAYYTHKTVQKAIDSGISQAHEFLTSKLVDMLQTYKKDLMTTNVGASAPLQFCANLRMLPLLFNALLKHVGLKKSSQISSDIRAAAICLLTTLPIKYLIRYIHPDFYSLHDMAPEVGLPDSETRQLILPPKLNLSGERIVSHGLYLIDDGQTQFLWVGRDAVPQLLQDAFGVSAMNEVPNGKVELATVDSELNTKIHNIINKSRERIDSITWPTLFIIKEDGDPALRLWASTYLIEDRTDSSVGYAQFLNTLREKINS